MSGVPNTPTELLVRHRDALRLRLLRRCPECRAGRYDELKDLGDALYHPATDYGYIKCQLSRDDHAALWPGDEYDF